MIDSDTLDKVLDAALDYMEARSEYRMQLNDAIRSGNRSWDWGGRAEESITKAREAFREAITDLIQKATQP